MINKKQQDKHSLEDVVKHKFRYAHTVERKPSIRQSQNQGDKGHQEGESLGDWYDRVVPEPEDNPKGPQSGESIRDYIDRRKQEKGK